MITSVLQADKAGGIHRDLAEGAPSLLNGANLKLRNMCQSGDRSLEGRFVCHLPFALGRFFR